ncbi:hypothetical protein B0H17DRAFT_1151424 [Mycena rosella]|uniref:Uncharacterized protein n=1 Tax=Mycena rosella TaxID=1033263 RepID=A0AAD7BL33_MYCRO|nr:hypothetical protein B0H17DRAFT_1151424 [Mycena rosella]
MWRESGWQGARILDRIGAAEPGETHCWRTYGQSAGFSFRKRSIERSAASAHGHDAAGSGRSEGRDERKDERAGVPLIRGGSRPHPETAAIRREVGRKCGRGANRRGIGKGKKREAWARFRGRCRAGSREEATSRKAPADESWALRNERQAGRCSGTRCGGATGRGRRQAAGGGTTCQRDTNEPEFIRKSWKILFEVV